MSRLYRVLEECLCELEKGNDPEAILSRYPRLAGQLRPILQDFVELSRNRDGSFVGAHRRSRLRVFLHLQKLKEAGQKSRDRTARRIQRFATALFAISICVAIASTATRASESALPGDQLYPIKRAWEKAHLVLASHPERRRTLVVRFENERLREVKLLLENGQEEWVELAGHYLEIDGMQYVSGIPIRISALTALPDEPLDNNQTMIVEGRTSVCACVDAVRIRLQPSNESVLYPSETNDY